LSTLGELKDSTQLTSPPPTHQNLPKNHYYSELTDDLNKAKSKWRKQINTAFFVRLHFTNGTRYNVEWRVIISNKIQAT
jgi:hypothetical protein